MPFPNASDRRITAHLADGLEILCQQQSSRANARSGGSGLGASMPATDNDDIELLRFDHVDSVSGRQF
jgi:hypothetical protein